MMNKQEMDKELDHDYDGIKEFDNPLPGWWLLTFYGAVVFAALYIAYYHFGPGPGPLEQLARDREAMQKASQQAPSAAGDDDALFAAALASKEKLAAGAKVFQDRCVSCHAAGGAGSIGPNLTDKFWIHGDGSMPAIAKVVREGVLDKGMPPWGTMLKPEEVIDVVAFVKSLKGTNPPGAKAPQGNEVKD